MKHLIRPFSLALAVFLQLAPLATRWAQSIAPRLSLSPLAQILKWSGWTAAVAGSYHSLSGATTLTSPNQATGKVGEEFFYQGELTTNDRGVYPFYGAEGISPTPRDLSTLGFQVSIDGSITGVPNRAGTFRIRLTGCDNTRLRPNYCGTATVTLRIEAAGDPLAISAHPQNLTVTAGQSATLSITATGPEPITYRWIKDGIELPTATSSTLTFNPATVADDGSYTCRVTAGGQTVVSNPAKLTVLGPPLITSSPQQISLHPGEPIQLAVTVQGNDPMSFAWSKGNQVLTTTAIPSATPITAATANDAGVYSVTVTGPGGAASGTAATVAIVPLAIQSSKLNPTGITLAWSSIPGRTYRIAASDQPSGPFAETLKIATAGPGATTETTIPISGVSRKFIRIIARAQ